MKHDTQLICQGTWYAWSCTCGRGSRHVAPLLDADRNARAHERKYNAALAKIKP